MAFAIYDGKILSAINFSAGCFNGQDAGKAASTIVVKAGRIFSNVFILSDAENDK
jgi:hypothetical protein